MSDSDQFQDSSGMGSPERSLADVVNSEIFTDEELSAPNEEPLVESAPHSVASASRPCSSSQQESTPQPLHGTLSLDSKTGKLVFLPAPNQSGASWCCSVTYGQSWELFGCYKWFDQNYEQWRELLGSDNKGIHDLKFIFCFLGYTSADPVGGCTSNLSTKRIIDSHSQYHGKNDLCWNWMSVR